MGNPEFMCYWLLASPDPREGAGDMETDPKYVIKTTRL